MPDPIANVVTRPVSGAEADIITSYYPIPGLGFVPINAFLLHAQEPVLIDTGPFVLREQYFGALAGLIQLEELRWIYLTHADPDHVGCLREVLAAAPRARIITTFLGWGRLGLYEAVPPDRVYLLNPGQSISVGDRELDAITPPIFDAPDTTAFVDSRTGALFSSDCFGGLVSGPASQASDIPAAALRDGAVTWASIDSPWLREVDEATLEARLDRIRELDAPIVLSSHLPPAVGMLDVLLGHIASARTAPPFLGPDQVAVTALLASLSQPPETSRRDLESRPHA